MVVSYGRSRSFTVIEIVTNQKALCDFLLVFLSNCVPDAFYRFQDNDLLVANLLFSRRFFATQCLLKASQGVFSWT